MKPFDLTRVLAGDPIICRNGEKIIEWHYWKSLGIFEYLVKSGENNFLHSTLEDGRIYRHSNNVSEHDLFMAD